MASSPPPAHRVSPGLVTCTGHARLARPAGPAGAPRAIVPAALVLFVLQLILTSGCTPQPHVGQHEPILQPIVVPYRPPTTVVVCIDASFTSRAWTTSAIQWVAAVLDASVRPNAGSLTAYITVISTHTYDAYATPLVVQIPSLPSQPLPPPLALSPTPSANPYQDAAARARIMQTNAQRLRAYQQTLAQQDALLARTREHVMQQTNLLRRLHPPVDYQSADVYGCIDRASERFSQATADEHVLLVAGDMRDDAWQSYLPPTAVPLLHARVRVVYFACSPAPDCRSRQASWTRYLRAAGADSVVLFYEPAVVSTLPLDTFFDPSTQQSNTLAPLAPPAPTSAPSLAHAQDGTMSFAAAARHASAGLTRTLVGSLMCRRPDGLRGTSSSCELRNPTDSHDRARVACPADLVDTASTTPRGGSVTI